MDIQDIAHICHEANRAYCKTLGDYSQPTWDEAPEWQRDSAINGVQFILDNPAALPSLAHDNWCKQKRAEGWVHGIVKDPDLKTHPCLVPYGELPKEQQVKDLIFTRLALTLLAAL